MTRAVVAAMLGAFGVVCCWVALTARVAVDKPLYFGNDDAGIFNEIASALHCPADVRVGDEVLPAMRALERCMHARGTLPRPR